MHFRVLLQTTLVIAAQAAFFGGLSNTQGTILAAKDSEERSSNSLLAMSASRYASASDEVEIRRRGLRLKWEGTVFVTLKNVSLTILRVVDRPWYYDYSVNIFDSEGKLVLPTARGATLLESPAR
jgi:hypothetical protein